MNFIVCYPHPCYPHPGPEDEDNIGRSNIDKSFMDATYDATVLVPDGEEAREEGAAVEDSKHKIAGPQHMSSARIAWEKFRDLCYIIQKSKKFEHLTTAMILSNAIVLALIW